VFIQSDEDEKTGQKLHKDPAGRRQTLISAQLETPIPVMGLLSQYLGDVSKSHVAVEDGSVIRWELRTPWQTIALLQSEVTYDSEEGVFRLVRS